MFYLFVCDTIRKISHIISGLLQTHFCIKLAVNEITENNHFNSHSKFMFRSMFAFIKGTQGLYTQPRPQGLPRSHY